jgi:hypothetical protein
LSEQLELMLMVYKAQRERLAATERKDHRAMLELMEIP